MTEPTTPTGKRLDNDLCYDSDPASYLPGEYIKRYHDAIIVIEKEAAASAIAKVLEWADRYYGEMKDYDERGPLATQLDHGSEEYYARCRVIAHVREKMHEALSDDRPPWVQPPSTMVSPEKPLPPADPSLIGTEYGPSYPEAPSDD